MSVRLRTDSQRVIELPDEVVIRFLSLLPADMLCHTASVCKQWQNVSADEILWQKICLAREWQKWEGAQSWRTLACFMTLFSGAALRYAPTFTMVSSGQKSPEENGDIVTKESLYKSWDQLIPPQIYRAKRSKENRTVKIYDCKTENKVRDQRHSCAVVFCKVVEEFLIQVDQEGVISLFNLHREDSFLYEFKETLKSNIVRGTLLGYQLELYDRFLVTFLNKNRNRSEESSTIISVYALDASQKNFNFILDGRTTCFSLKDNILALNTYTTFNTLYFINLKERVLNSYTKSDSQHDGGSYDQMCWKEVSLLILRSHSSAKRPSTLEKWDFTSLQPEMQQPTSLLDYQFSYL